MEKKITVTKDKIKKYLKNYIYLSQLIKARELNWIIGRGPSFQEWQEGVNTVELQAINLIEDEKLAELRFYRNYIHKYMLVSEDVRDKKIYKYFIFKYVQNYNENLIHNLLREKDLSILDKELVDYLYSKLKLEADKNGKS